MRFYPSYLNLYKSGDLKKRVEKANKLLEKCRSCPRTCEINRIKNETGICLSGYLPIVSSYTAHYGEEPGLSGTRGAGNIFFGNCNMKCVFCQNFEISQNWKQEKNNEISFEKLADVMIELQNRNCHNIGLVSPTHFSLQILKSIYLAVEKGLSLPIIYNSNGYDSVEILRLYEDIIDIYLPDMKYGNNDYGKSYSNANKYYDSAKEAIKEMFKQVGDELVYENGVVVRGLIIRHLVLPNDLSDTENVLKFISKELSPNVHVSLMSQYYPANKAYKEILLNRTLRPTEYDKALILMDKYGLKNGWIQEMESHNNYRPRFNSNRLAPFD